MSSGAARRLPAPRPALRKAADADHHPAAGPAGAPNLTEAPASPDQPPVAAPEGGGARGSGPPQSAAATAFWDALQSDAAAALRRDGSASSAGAAAPDPEGPAPVLTSTDTPGKSGTAKSGGRKSSAAKKFQGATSDSLRKDRPEHELLLGKQVTLEVKIPKRLRKAAQAQAQRHGATLDNVVTGLLAGWVDGS